MTVLALAFFCLGIGTAQTTAQTNQPSETNLKSRQWSQDAKFGMFIH